MGRNYFEKNIYNICIHFFIRATDNDVVGTSIFATWHTMYASNNNNNNDDKM